MDAMNLLVSFLLLMVTATSMTAAQATPKPGDELKITTILSEPFLMITSAGTFEGYIVDLVNALADEVGFKYKLKLVADGRYGALTPDGKWNGMIGELINKTVDMSAAPLTITYMRSQVVDFSKPYLNLGTTIVMRKPTRERQSSMFAILAPFEAEVWVFIVIAYAVMSFILFLLGRFTEWQQNPNSDIEERNAFSCLNSAWFLFGFPGKAGLTPISLSVRIVSAVWWIFSFFVFATYVASLSSIIGVVSNSTLKPTVQSASDLAAQTKIKYGTIAGGSTMAFFKTSRITVYQKMWQFMSSHEPSVFVNTNKDGFERARRGNYAFITESTMIDYVVQKKPCSLMKVGGLLDSKAFGIAFPKGSPYKDLVNLALLKLIENGRLHQLYQKWFHSNECPRVDDDADEFPRHLNIGVSEIRGAFVILVLGVIVAVVVAIFECLYRTAQRSKDKKTTFIDQFSSDQKRSVGGCCSTTRDVTPPPRSAPPSELKQGA
ncbi:glutamate receptor ionotropic, kainate 2-like [Tubulanus polymorphus]|uniref:glutamate receptor ionotropic, kainate 2-like n=1 Tax=Tubulanus polymorphus TaxID=672921 RepID=UPI003DA3E2D3